MRLSLVVPAARFEDPAGIRELDLAMAAFPAPWERLTWVLGPPGCSSSAAEKNRAWHRARGEWVLFLGERQELPPLELFDQPLAVDCICTQPAPGPLELRPPFALRRTLLEELDGFRDLPGGLEEVELWLRLRQSGASILHPTDWLAASGPAARKPAFETVLALYWRHPCDQVLNWACAQTGEPAADGESLEEWFARAFGRPLPVQSRLSLAELAEHFAERSAPPLLPAGEIAEMLDAAAASGLHGSGTAGNGRFERSHAANWLLANTAYFEAMAERNLCLLFPPPRLRDGPRAEPLTLSLEGRYEVEIAAGALVGLRSPCLSLPLPVACREQQDLELFGFDPPELEQGLDPTGTTVGLELPAAAGKAVRLGFSFRCIVHEGSGGSPGSPGPLRPVPLGARNATEVEAILATIFRGGAPDPSPRLRAHRIYAWILDHIAFRWSERLGLFALEARAGNCAHRVRLFSLLCGRAGLAVRERCGILAGDLHSHGLLRDRRWAATERVDRGYPLTHVWAEVWLGEEGWWPVDFNGADSGRRMMTPQNVRAPATWERLRAWSPRLDDYYFGSVDPYRVHFGAVPKTLSGIPSGVPGDDLEAIWRLAWATRHSLRTRFSGLPPAAFEESR